MKARENGRSRGGFRKLRMFLIICGAIVLLAAVILLAAVHHSRARYFRKTDFVPNKWDEPYSQGVPLEEMDFRPYAKYLNIAVMPILRLPRLQKRMALPCDVHYYTHKGDSEPAITLEKGTEVYIIPSSQDGLEFTNIGYGLRCWPDYEKGWRYGQPFSDDRSAEPLPPGQQSENAPMYFVKTAELEKVAHAYWKDNKDHYFTIPTQISWADRWIAYPITSLAAEWSYPYTITREIDKLLYRNGAFCSPDLA